MSKQFYLIQRGSFRNIQDAHHFFGSTREHLIDGDYMGAAEFEWGAIPKAYRRIMDNFSKSSLHVTDLVTIKGVPFCIFCQDECYEEILAELKRYLNNPYPLKEWTNLEVHFQEKVSEFDKHALKTNFWWCIDANTRYGHEHIGDWIAFIGDTDRQKKFMEILTNDHDKWWMVLTEEELEEERKKAYRTW